jgi:uracil-DNA glycosylase
MKIVFVGSNPSWASTVSKAFDESTYSGRVLRGWTKQIEGDHLFRYANVCDTPTPNNRPLKDSEIKDHIDQLQVWLDSYGESKVVALGKTAAKALTLLRVPFFEMPHPSGLNRQLNDPEFVAEKIKRLKEFILEP